MRNRSKQKAAKPQQPQGNNLEPLGLDEAKARPVTLGVIAALAAILVGMIGFVWSDLRDASKELHEFKVSQGVAMARQEVALADVKESLKSIAPVSRPQSPPAPAPAPAPAGPTQPGTP